MKFDKSKVYTALNADESLVGTKGYFARDIEALKCDIENEYKIEEFRRFNDNYVYQAGTGIRFNFFYLVEPAPEKWYVYENVDGSYFKHNCSAIFQKHSYSGSEKECDSWIEDHSKPKYRPFKDCDELREKKMTEEELQEIADIYGLYTQIDVDNFTDELISKLNLQNQRLNKLKKENEELIKGVLNNLDGQKARKNHYMKENEEMKKKLSLMRHFIYGNYDLEYKEMQLKHIDEFGKPL